jgi:heterogeneous nuclear rnp K-like protein
MSASPTLAALPSSKRPLEDPSSPSGPTDLPDAKRPALDKAVKEGDDADKASAAAETADSGVETEEVEVKNEAAATTNGSKDTPVEKIVADAADNTSQIPTVDTQPIKSTASQSDRATSHPPSGMPTQDETNWIHVRAVISSAEAATCIGKGGENVAMIRRLSNAKCTVSDYARGAVERILTVSGQQDAVAKVYWDSISPSSDCTNLCTGIWPYHSDAEQ